MSKRKKAPEPGVIRSDPATVKRLLADHDAHVAEHELMQQYYREHGLGMRTSGHFHGLRTRNNAGHPYQGGLPGLGKDR